MKRSWGRLALLLGSVASLCACTALLGSFDVAADGVGPEAGTDSSPSSDGPTPGVDAADALPPVECKSPEVACGPVCANLMTAGDHCGKCTRSCGGGSCTQGVCGPAEIVKLTTSKINTMDVGAASVFFSIDDKLVSCPKEGCGGAPPKQLGQTMWGFGSVTAMNNGTVVFESAPVQNTTRPAMYGCPLAGCPAVLTSWIADGLNGFESRIRVQGGDVFVNSGGFGLAWTTCNAGACTSPGKTLGLKGTHGFVPAGPNVYFVDSTARGGAIAKCVQSETACMPTVVVPGDQTDVESLAFDNGTLYWIKKGRDGFTEGKLFGCSLASDCTVAGNVKLVVNGLDSPTDLMVDASGYYWITAAKKLQRCLPGNCPGGAQDLVPVALDAPHSLTHDLSFVYWAETFKITRLAK
ncbi:hypothetical protein BH11MYX4_BH11MYX4_39920 [soil metagenome]